MKRRNRTPRPAESLSAPAEPAEPAEPPARFDPADCALTWLRAAAGNDGNLPWAWTPTIGRTINANMTATVTTTLIDPGQWWIRDDGGWQPTGLPQIRATLDQWGHAHAGFSEHPGRADATSQHAVKWLRGHATHTTGDAGQQQYGRPPTTWAHRGTDGQLPADAGGCAELFIVERYYPPAPRGGRRLGHWHGGFHAWTGGGWHRLNSTESIEIQVRDWLGGAQHVDVPVIVNYLAELCHHTVGHTSPTPVELCDVDQQRAARQAAKTIVPQPIGAPA